MLIILRLLTVILKKLIVLTDAYNESKIAKDESFMAKSKFLLPGWIGVLMPSF